MLSGVFQFCILAAFMSVIIAVEPHVANGQHGLEHPAVVIDFPSLECACDDSNASSTSSGRERGGDASLHVGTCKAGGQARWVFAVRGLVPGFSYKLHFKWSLEDDLLEELDLSISTTTSSFAVRTPLAESGQNGTSTFDLIAHSRKLHMDMALWDVYPGLTEEEALIGARNMDLAVNTVRVLCTDSDSGERTKVPDGEEDEWRAPVWLLPEGGKSLCSVVVVLVSGLRSALQRYSGLFPAAHLDGKDVSEDMLLSLLSSKPSYLSLPSGLHTLNLELINISSDGKREGLWTGGCCDACVGFPGVRHPASR
jgi:hypothetical protein